MAKQRPPETAMWPFCNRKRPGGIETGASLWEKKDEPQGEANTLNDRVESHLQDLERETARRDRNQLYLRTLVITASHLVDVTTYMMQASPGFRVGDPDVFCYMEACVRRLRGMAAPKQNAASWKLLFHEIDRCMALARNWSGDPATTIKAASVLFTSMFILARLANDRLVMDSIGVDVSFAAEIAKLPWPIPVSSTIEEQASIATRNARWLRLQIL